MFSAMYHDLDEQGKKRYREKLKLIGPGCHDPYVTSSTVRNCEDSLFPPVQWPDIHNHLINAPSPYTRQELKAFKSLEAYRYMTSGWVGDLRVFPATYDRAKVFGVTCHVRHSQSVSASPVKPWVALESSGEVICAHCSCMAGLGEACSHIAALLFVLEARTRYMEDTSCTSKRCEWLPPCMKQLTFSEIVNVDFSTPSQKRKKQLTSRDGKQSQRFLEPSTAPKPPTKSELDIFYSSLAKTCKLAVLSLVPKFSEGYIPKRPDGFPQPLTDLYDENMLDVSREVLRKHCDEVLTHSVCHRFK